MSKTPFLNSQFAAVFTLSDRLSLGAAILGPHSTGKQEWPEQVSGPNGSQPASSRFILAHEASILAWPTVSLAYRVSDTLSLGGGFVWGFFDETAEAFAEGVSPPGGAIVLQDDFFARQELKLTAKGRDMFIPGVVLGMLWSPRPTVDVGLWYRKSAILDSEAEITFQSRYWTPTGQRNTNPCGPGEPSDCNITDPAGSEGRGTIVIPTEVRGGVRYHRPRGAGPSTGDPLVDDIFDIEIDLAWANNSAVDAVFLDLEPVAGVAFRGVNGLSTIPAETQIPKYWEDILSIRAGGEYVLRPGRFAVQAGTFFETKGQNEEDLHVHFDLARKAGVSGGGVVRVRNRFDIFFAFQQIFWADLDNRGAGSIPGLSGEPTTDHETRQIVNGGRLTSAMTEFASGVTIRF
jgi:long-chain fatty acid transport protein